MPKITKIYPLPANAQYPEEKVLVYIDYQKCTAVRSRTWSAMGLGVGSEISCDELRELEKFHFKKQYQAVGGWDKEKIRLDKVKALIESLDSRLKAKVSGFGADTNQFIAAHPEVAGKPDIEVVIESTGEMVSLVEVSGTEYMRGETYWVRPDKLAYARSHPETDVWIILHFEHPVDKFVIIRPDPRKAYTVQERVIRGTRERYVDFDDNSEELVGIAYLAEHLKRRIDAKLAASKI